MAQFSTGIESWDQGLGTLASGLFPDPSKVAQAGYYGAQQRKAGIESDQLLLDRTNRQKLVDLARSRPMPLGPDNTAAPPAAPAGQGLSQVLTTGTPPSASPPTAVSPPAPNTTGTDGSVPVNQLGQGIIKPGSLMDQGTTGGTFQAGPAASNGAHARVVGQAELIALYLQAGYPEPAARAAAQAQIDDWRQRNAIPEPTYNRMQSSAGNQTPYAQTAETGRTIIADRGATQRTGMEVGQRDRVLAENRRQAEMTPTDTGGPNPTILPRKDAYGKPVYNANIYQTQQNPQNIVDPSGRVEIGTLGEQLAQPPGTRGRLSVGAPDVAVTPTTPPGQPTAPPINTPNTQLAGTGVPIPAERQRDTTQGNYIVPQTGLSFLATPQQVATMPPGQVRIADANSFGVKPVTDPNTGRTVGLPNAMAGTGAYELAPETPDAYTAQGFNAARNAERNERGVPRLSNALTFQSSGAPATVPGQGGPQAPAPAPDQTQQPPAPLTPTTPGGTLPPGAIKATQAPDGTEGQLNANQQKVVARGGFWYPADTPPLSQTLTQANVGGTAAGSATPAKPPDANEGIARDFNLNTEVANLFPAPQGAKTSGENVARATLSEPAKAEVARRAAALAVSQTKYRNDYNLAQRDALQAMVREGMLPAKLDRTERLGMLGHGPGANPNLIKGKTLNMRGNEDLFLVPFSSTGAFKAHNTAGKGMNTELHQQMGGK